MVTNKCSASNIYTISNAQTTNISMLYPSTNENTLILHTFYPHSYTIITQLFERMGKDWNGRKYGLMVVELNRILMEALQRRQVWLDIDCGNGNMWVGANWGQTAGPWVPLPSFHVHWTTRARIYSSLPSFILIRIFPRRVQRKYSW